MSPPEAFPEKRLAEVLSPGDGRGDGKLPDFDLQLSQQFKESGRRQRVFRLSCESDEEWRWLPTWYVEVRGRELGVAVCGWF